MSAQTKVSGTWRNMSAPYVKVGGTWKIAKSAWARVDSKWKSWFLQGGLTDSTFAEYDIYSGFNFDVTESAIQSDGKIILGGSFSTFNGVAVGRIVRLNTDGTIDNTFRNNTGTGANFGVGVILIQPDGQILVGGSFTTWNGATANRIVRLNSDGTRDATFTTNAGTAANDSVEAIARSSDGNIFLGGNFTTWNGATVNRIVKLNSSGIRDTTFTTNVGSASSNGGQPVSAIEVAGNGDIIVGGRFTIWNGTAVNRLIRLSTNGVRDTTFNTNAGTGPNGAPTSIAIQSNGQIILVGEFWAFNGVTVNYVVRLNSNGTRDTTFTTNVGSASSGTIQKVAIQSNGQIVVGGSFNTWSGATVNNFVRLNSDGTRDTAFTTSNGAGFTSRVWNFSFQSDSKIFVVGAFTTFNGNFLNRIVRLNSDGSRDTTFLQNTHAANNPVWAIEAQPDGKILVGGAFNIWNNNTANRIVRLNTDGTIDNTFNASSGGLPANGSPRSIVLQSNGQILVGGDFTFWNEVTVYYIVRLNPDGTRDTTFTTNAGTAANGGIKKILIQPDGKILVAGSFTTWNGVSQNYIVRLNADGTRDTSFTSLLPTLPPGSVYSYYDFVPDIALQNDGKIVVAFNLVYYDSSYTVETNETGIYRLNSNGSVDSAFSNQNKNAAGSTQRDFFVEKVAVQNNQQIIASGRFDTWNGATANRIVRLNSDGTRDATFTTNAGTAFDAGVSAMHIQRNQQVILSGDFTTFNGAAVKRMVRLNSNGTLDAAFDSNQGTGANNLINCMLEQHDGKIVIGGYFDIVNNQVKNYIARIGGDISG
jgi:uncharacterized delta-60 repeat protein